MTILDDEACWRALTTRDARFDGRFFTGVTSTGVYCRPVCPARTPLRKNVRFHPTAASAQEAGFRSCLRCRPECSPEAAVWRGASNTVSRALSLIGDGALDGEDASVAALADRLGVGERHLRRLFLQHLGATPIAVAQARRVHFAKRLIDSTDLPMTEVALAAGFGSVRRFNAIFQALYRRPPRNLRREGRRDRPTGEGGAVTLLLPYRAPYDWDALLSFLAQRAVDGVETVAGGVYRRTFLHAGQPGAVEVSHAPERSAVRVLIRASDPRALAEVPTRVRRVFDLDADIEAVTAHLSTDALLAPLVAARPGLRAPGGWDGFELAIRAVLGQQVTLEAARRLAGRLVAEHGVPVDPDLTGHPSLTRAFPTSEALAGADLSGLPMPRARSRTLAAVAQTALADPRLFHPHRSLDETVARLRAIPGVGDWTAQYIALRAAREPDAFPAADVGLLRAAAPPDGARPSPAALEARSAVWSPWRAYAAQHLWCADPVAAPPSLRATIRRSEHDHRPQA